MDSVFNFIATIIVAIISLIGIIIQTKSKERQENIACKIDELREESKNGDNNLSKKIDTANIQFLKVWLTVELTKVRDEIYKPNEEQKRLIIEAKKMYNDLGGNSYIDDMYNECKLKKLI